MRFQTLLSWLILFAFIAVVQWFIGWQKLFQPWLEFKPLNLVMALLLILLSYQIRTWRLYDYFYVDLKGYWLSALRLMLLHNILNTLLPMRSGELSFPLLMKRYFKVGYSRSVPALLWFRVLDLYVVLSLLIVPLLAFFWQHSVLRVMLMILLPLWLLLPLGLYVLKEYLKRVLDDLEMKTQAQVSDEKHKATVRQRLLSLVHQLVLALPQTKALLWRSVLLTWLNWLLKFAVLLWVLGQFVSLGIYERLLAVIAGELSSVLPIHAPGGFGTYEVGIVSALVKSVSLQEATQAAINVHLFVLGAALLGGILAWFLPLKKKD